MFLYLNPPRMFWAIEDSNIRLTRSNPFYEVSDEELEDLTEEQRSVLQLSVQAGVVAKINSGFIPKGGTRATIDYILTRSPSEIQRKYVARMVIAEDDDSLSQMKAKEESSEKPRQSVMTVIENGLQKIKRAKAGVSPHAELEFEELELEELEPEATKVVNTNEKS